MAIDFKGILTPEQEEDLFGTAPSEPAPKEQVGYMGLTPDQELDLFGGAASDYMPEPEPPEPAYEPSDLAKQFGGVDPDAQRRVDQTAQEMQMGAMPEATDEQALPNILSMLNSDKPLDEAALEAAGNIYNKKVDTSLEGIAKAKQRGYERMSQDLALASGEGRYVPKNVSVRSPRYEDVEKSAMDKQKAKFNGRLPAHLDKNSSRFDQAKYDEIVRNEYFDTASFPVPVQTVTGADVRGGSFQEALYEGFYAPEAIYAQQKAAGNLAPESAAELMQQTGPQEDKRTAFEYHFPMSAQAVDTLLSPRGYLRKPKQAEKLGDVAATRAMVEMLEQAEAGDDLRGSAGKVYNAARSYGANADNTLTSFRDKHYKKVLTPEGEETFIQNELTGEYEFDAVEFAGNFQRQLVETVGVIPAAGYYGWYAWKNDRDVVDDITTFAPAVGEYLFDEMKHFDRFAYNNPLDALGFAALGAGLAKASAGGLARGAGRLGAPGLAKGLGKTADIFAEAQRLTNPLYTAKQVGTYPFKKAFKYASEGYVPGFGELHPTTVKKIMNTTYAFMDPSELGAAVIHNPATGQTSTLFDLAAKKDGAVARAMNDSTNYIRDLAEEFEGSPQQAKEFMESMRDILFGELESGSKLYIKVPDATPVPGLPRQPMAKASGETILQLKKEMTDLNKAMTRLEEIGDALPKRRATADDFATRPELVDGDMVVDLGSGDPRLPHYMKMQEATDKLLQRYQTTFEKAFGEHVDNLPKYSNRNPSTLDVDAATQSKFFKQQNPRVQVEVVGQGKVVGVEYFPHNTYNRLRYADVTNRMVDEALATGGKASKKSLREIVSRWKEGAPIGFLADDIIAKAYNLKVFDELEAQVIARKEAKKKISPALDEKYREMRRKIGYDEMSPDELNMLRWAGDTFTVPAMQDAVGVYSTKMPDGTLMHVEQLSSPQRHASEMRGHIMRLAARAVELDLLNAGTYMNRLSEYFPHFYQLEKAKLAAVQEVDQAIAKLVKKRSGVKNPTKANKLDMQIQELRGKRAEYLRDADAIKNELTGGPSSRTKHFKKEKNAGLEFEEKLDKGLNDNAVKAGLQGILNLTDAVETGVFFDQLSKMQYADGTPFVSNKPIGPAWQKLPDSGAYGKLANKYVAPDVHYFMTDWNASQSAQFASYDAALNSWKQWATIMNPATHVRNVMSNSVFATMNGGNPLMPGNSSARKAWGNPFSKDGVIRQAFTMRGKDVDAALSDRAIGTDFTQAELGLMDEIWEGASKELKNYGKGEFNSQFALANLVMRGKEIAHNLAQKALKPTSKTAAGKVLRKLYQFEENVFKLARYKQAKILREEFKKTGNITFEMERVFGDKDTAIQALSVDDSNVGRMAAKEANKWYFDYGDTSSMVNMARRYYSPFITFQYKAVPLLFKWMQENPAQAFMYRRAFETLNMMIEYGDTKDISREEIFQRERERKALPAYLKDTSIRLPISEKRTFAGLGERDAAQYADVQYYTPAGGIVQRASGYDTPMFPATFSLAMPSNPLATAFMNQMYNQDYFSGREIRQPGMTPGEAASATAVNLAESILPPIGRQVMGLMEVVNQEPRRGYKGGVLQDYEEFVGDKVFGFKKRIVQEGDYSKLKRQFQIKENAINDRYRQKFQEAVVRGADPEELAEIRKTAEQQFQDNKEWYLGQIDDARYKSALKAKAIR